MLIFDDSFVYSTDDNYGIIQLYAHGQESGHPASARLNAMRRLRDQLEEEISRMMVKDFKRRREAGEVIPFKKHG